MLSGPRQSAYHVRGTCRTDRNGRLSPATAADAQAGSGADGEEGFGHQAAFLNPGFE